MAKRDVIDFHINLNLNIRGLSPSATLAINEKSNRIKSEGREIIKLGLGQSPFPVPDVVVESLARNAYRKDYLPVRGLAELREAVAHFNLRTQKVNTRPEDVLVGPGSKELIFLLQLVYYGDLIIPTPSWVSYSPQARIVGRNVNWIPANIGHDLEFSPEMLEEICRTDPSRPRIVILNYPTNPTGSSYSIERLKLLAEVARKYQVILVSDEIYGLLHHNNKHVSIARFYPEGTIISNGISKWCGAGGWRLGTFSFPEQLRWLLDAMAAVASETYTSTSTPIQYAAVTAFEGSPQIDEYLVKARKVLKIILRFLVFRFSKMHITFPNPQGGFYIFPNFEYYREALKKTGISTSVELCNKLLDDTGVALLPGSDFGMDPHDLSARLAYVDFDGREALKGIDPLLNIKLNGNRGTEDAFLNQCTPKIILAVDKIEAWLNNLAG